MRALTVEAVAARSGVAKTTIYRRWRDKWELALDAVMIDMLPRFPDPVDVRDTRKELITFVDRRGAAWRREPTAMSFTRSGGLRLERADSTGRRIEDDEPAGSRS